MKPPFAGEGGRFLTLALTGLGRTDGVSSRICFERDIFLSTKAKASRGVLLNQAY